MNLKKTLSTAGMAVLLCAAAHNLMAQDNGGGATGGGGAGNNGGRRAGGGGGFGGGNFDPAEMQQRIMENIRDQMSVTNTEEWTIIEGRVQKVMDARRDVGGPNFGRLFRRRNNDGGDNGPGGGGRRGGFFGAPSPELESLQNAIDNNAPAEQVKAALEKYRASRKAKEAALEKAQDDLKSVLTVKQEAVAVSLGLVN
jgi:hypothetical protein